MEISEKITFVLCAFFLAACSGKKYATINKMEKAAVLKEHMAAEETTDGEYRGVPAETIDGGSQPSEGAQNTDGGNHAGNDGKDMIGVKRSCRGEGGHPNVTETSAVTLKITDDGEVKCQISGANVREQVLQGKVRFPGCDFSKLSPYAKMESYNAKGEPLGTGVGRGMTKQNVSGISRNQNGLFFQLIVMDGQDPDAYELLTLSHKLPEICDVYLASPLVVDMRPRYQLKQPIHLTAPKNGVNFDILGENANPYAHAKKKISWIKDPLVMPIVLPRNNQVHGVDEMFGDNTKGPDGKFAANGFAALAKHDGNGDKLITEEDPVYSKLRLWSDRNRDGVAQSHELYTLKQMSMTVIDLTFDPDYYRQDQYGNEFLYKSVVKREQNGKSELRPVFDIWFVIDEFIQ